MLPAMTGEGGYAGARWRVGWIDREHLQQFKNKPTCKDRKAKLESYAMQISECEMLWP